MRKFWIVGIMLLISIACNNDRYNPIPNISFYGTINLELPQYNYTSFVVKYAGNVKLGHNGVVVLKLSNSNYDISAFDLMCPHDHDAPGYFYTELETNGDLEVVCPQCNSHFNLAANGSPTEGPAQFTLRQYQTNLNGNYLTISN
nr:Rieske 2Fe-2S domain-containing protein [uncultured Carboxylicivirga sp.]